MVKQTKNNQFGEVFAIGSEFLESLKAVRSARVRESHGRKTIKAIKIRTFRARAREGCNKGAKTCNKKTACFRLHQMHTSRTCARREPSAAGGGGSQNLMTLRPRKPRSLAREEKKAPERIQMVAPGSQSAPACCAADTPVRSGAAGACHKHCAGETATERQPERKRQPQRKLG